MEIINTYEYEGKNKLMPTGAGEKKNMVSRAGFEPSTSAELSNLFGFHRQDDDPEVNVIIKKKRIPQFCLALVTITYFVM